MYDQIGVPREGCASFSDDGYPVVGLVELRAGREPEAARRAARVPAQRHARADPHAESDPSGAGNRRRQLDHDHHAERGRRARRARHRASPACSPIRSSSAINTTVRHHLNHMPDPVIRPGGWPFASWFPTGAPQAADRHDFAPLGAVARGDGRRPDAWRSASRWICRGR